MSIEETALGFALVVYTFVSLLLGTNRKCLLSIFCCSFDGIDDNDCKRKPEQKDLCLNTENIYLVFACQQAQSERKRMTQSLVCFLSLFYCPYVETYARCDNIFFAWWLVLFCVRSRREKEMLSHVNRHIHPSICARTRTSKRKRARDDGIGRYDNIFFLFLSGSHCRL